jgi:DNA mismatch endonuclease (patch repair protein)
MSRVRQRDTALELLVRSALHRRGLRFRKNVRTLSGSPDVVLAKHSAVVFVHGCFWHRHGCSLATTPKTNAAFWREKFDANVQRDRRVASQLRREGWRVFVVWQCQLQRAPQMVKELLDRLANNIQATRHRCSR